MNKLKSVDELSHARLAAIELPRRIRKGQFNLAKRGIKDPAAQALREYSAARLIRYPDQ